MSLLDPNMFVGVSTAANEEHYSQPNDVMGNDQSQPTVVPDSEPQNNKTVANEATEASAPDVITEPDTTPVRSTRKANRVKVAAPKYNSSERQRRSLTSESSPDAPSGDDYRVTVNLSQELWAALNYRILSDKLAGGRGGSNASTIIRRILEEELASDLKRIREIELIDKEKRISG